MYNIKLKREILNHVNNSINYNKPFSLIRFGDGGLKMMLSYIKNKEGNLKIISEKEGIPLDKFQFVINLWAIYANKSDYIDTPHVYENTYNFWKRYKLDFKPINVKTNELLKNWENVYNSIHINTKDRLYCNPEFNWLSILNYPPNIFNVLHKRKICFISIFDDIPVLSDKFDVTYKKIVGHYDNQFENSFQETIEYIEENIDNFDLWLNSSGELGRIYSGRIRELGGRVIDMGFVAQYWKDGKMPLRFNKFIRPDEQNPLCIKLTTLGESYRNFI